MLETEICGCCKQNKFLSDFHKNRSKASECALWYRATHKEKAAEYQPWYRQAHKKKRIEYSQFSKGKESQRKFDKKYNQTLVDKAIQKEANMKHRNEYSEQIKVISIVNSAIKLGKLKRSVFCEHCGLPAETQARHLDYSKPLEVEWLCTHCYIELHFSFKRKCRMKKTLLRRKLDYIADGTIDKVDELFNRNHVGGVKPDGWKGIETTEDFNKMLKHCPNLNKIYAAGMEKELGVLYAAAELMEEEEFEDIQENDIKLAELLLGGPQTAFCFELNEESLKEVERLRIVREEI